MVQATIRIRSLLVWPTLVYRSSPPTISTPRSIGSLAKICSTSSGETLWRPMCPRFASSQSKTKSSATTTSIHTLYVLLANCAGSAKPVGERSADQASTLGNPEGRNMTTPSAGQERTGKNKGEEVLVVSHLFSRVENMARNRADENGYVAEQKWGIAKRCIQRLLIRSGALIT